MIFKTEPRAYQLKVFEERRNDAGHALFAEMGLGKSKILLDVASYLYQEVKVDGMLIVVPNEVLGNWSRIEVPTHFAGPYITHAHRTSGSSTIKEKIKREIILEPRLSSKTKGLRILEITYDALNTEKGYDLAKRFLLAHRTIMVLDEASAIGKPKSKRSRDCHRLSELAHYRWALTGTPTADSPFKLYSVMKFVMPGIWKRVGMDNYTAFKSQFAIFEDKYANGREYQELVAFKDLDRLHRIVSPYSTRLLKEDHLDLPPKVYEKRFFELSARQRDVYDDLRKNYLTEIERGLIVEAPMAIVRMTRLQQIASGYVKVKSAATLAIADLVQAITAQDVGQMMLFEDEVLTSDEDYAAAIAQGPIEEHEVELVSPEYDPRLVCLRETLEDLVGKVIVFCRFKQDVERIVTHLGEKVLRYDGTTRSRDRAGVLTEFKSESGPRVLVANLAAMSRGVTLTIAKNVVYYSNMTKLEFRLQSEDRTHRIGQDSTVTIVDLIARDTIDEHIVDSLQKKFDVSAQANGDRLREWLS